MSDSQSKPFKVVFLGTEFQRRVWTALCECPVGQTCSYRDLAHSLDCASSVRAAASAVGANRLAVVVPCHHVIRQDGNLGGFR
ncbi:MAG: methylated-DNA--[protein]-cysteine S-methyltransferase [Gammaproteobacteria bacterium]